MFVGVVERQCTEGEGRFKVALADRFLVTAPPGRTETGQRDYQVGIPLLAFVYRPKRER